MRALATLLILIVPASAAAYDPHEAGMLPISVPERPFLLVDAPRRFTPSEPAIVRLQQREGGELRLAVFRVKDPTSLLSLSGRHQGVSVASDPIGAEAEQLLITGGGLPRASGRLTLMSDETVRMPSPNQTRRVWDEQEVYDEHEPEESDVATYWVRTGQWSVRHQSLGRLQPGLYLVRAHAGPWATTALLSVGNLVVLARRGDTHDLVRVTDADGSPTSAVQVFAEHEGRTIGQAQTNAEGIARFRANDVQTIRYRVVRGEDVAWTDVAHARLDPCDPRVYLATGRPVYRNDEVIHVRGHVRGCSADGNYIGLAGETITVRSGGSDEVEATSDADGNFTAQVTAHGTGLSAELRGRHHEREVQIDDRRLPTRDVLVDVDRPVAAAGQVITVRVADEDGGWPTNASVMLETPAGRLLDRVGPGRAAEFDVVVPNTIADGERFEISATVTDGGRITTARSAVWVGRSPIALEVTSDKTRARVGEPFEVSVSAEDLSGTASPGEVVLTLFESDGNEGRGRVRHRTTVALDASGTITQPIPLSGRGPWIVEAKRGSTRAELIVWARERPPALSRRGPLAILPSVERIAPGSTLSFDVRLPPGGGRSWITLEQGSVWSTTTVGPAPGRTVRAEIQIPDRARGMARVVATHVRNGRVETASAAVEVSTSREIRVSLDTDKREYGGGDTARVVVTAQDLEGRPSDGVLTLWLADAGYWGLGQEEYPLPGPYLAQTGRMASAGDSTRPLGFGSEEGRVLPHATMEWNGATVPGSTFRHGWGSYGTVVRMDETGSLQDVLEVLARRAGLRGASVCPDTNTEAGTVHLKVVDLPYDMVAAAVAGEVAASAIVRGGRLEMPCGGMGMGGMGGGGAGYGSGGGSIGAGRLGTTREDRMYGTLHFVPLERLGPDGRAEIEVPLPDHPGRWRIETIVIADDGGGARAHRIVHTQQALVAWLDAPPRIAPGDAVDAAVRVSAPVLANQSISLNLTAVAGAGLDATTADSARLDSNGRATIPVRLTARHPGRVPLTVSVRGGAHRDDVRGWIDVIASDTDVPIAIRTLVAEDETDVHLPLPELSSPATLQLTVDPDLSRSIQDAFDAVRQERWMIPVMRIDRIAALRSLRTAASTLGDGAEERALALRIQHAYHAELEALAAMRSSSGGHGWWHGIPDSPRLTSMVLVSMEDDARGGRTELLDALRMSVRRHPVRDPEIAAVAALALSKSERQEDQQLAATLLATASAGRTVSMEQLAWTARAAEELNDDDARDRALTQLAEDLEVRVAAAGAPDSCRGPVWFLCIGDWGERGQASRAATTLLSFGTPDARRLAIATASWLARRRPVDRHFVWGSGEAEELELLSSIMTPRRARPQLHVRVDGRRVQLRGGGLDLPAGAHEITVRFARRDGRLLRLRVDGRIQTPASTTHTGPVRIGSSFRKRNGMWALVIETQLPRAAHDAELRIPLPAALSPSAGAEPPAGASLSQVSGSLRITIPRLRAGRQRIIIPLVEHGSGRFHAGSPSFRSADAELWGLGPATEVVIQR